LSKVKRALISVSDKMGIVEFAEGLSRLGVEIISTGGTARVLSEAGIAVRTISDLTGFPELMDGRVKTLHPKVHGAILALRDDPSHMRDVEENGIELIDLVVVNLYPFGATIAREDVSLQEAIENIDIGGPTLLRSAAKNYRYVGVVTDPSDYKLVLNELETNGDLSPQTRAMLCVKAFRLTADYDAAIDRWLSERLTGEKVLRLKYCKGQNLRYGENWHQKARFYKDDQIGESCISNARQLHGKQMSYNNYLDADAALEAVKELDDTIGVAVIKHTNPCGYATGRVLRRALEAAWQGDPVSAMGSIIACTVPIDLSTAQFLKGRFVEIVIAPGYQSDALEFLQQKSKDLRILEVPPLGSGGRRGHTYRHIVGGVLEQERDLEVWDKWEVVTKAEFPQEKRALAQFAWKAAKHTKSNAIVLAREYEPGQFQVIGMGAGQPNRVDSLRKLAVTKARENLELIYREGGSDLPWDKYFRREMSKVVLASDAFFPFDDTLVCASQHHIRYVVQPGGAMRDKEIIATADRLGISMVFTGMRHFLH